ncbi:sugar-transfer associated ATP-grasp domain-containing protein [Arsukibacterium sp.]|uniref:sugar-transfer associated ATP-grasp domain-containing protein n=1 Tax=Arsukibacterium sp. TaxID=1977258 RepID=UPI00299DE314|nr:sugar-transfer associated ATP-grasp domain-containing protein [Arsukibacterium sp.]MDX1538466.1 sugar-transfer associated ATP-grasp domain-containing protein [Arsukibacterium sp.]
MVKKKFFEKVKLLFSKACYVKQNFGKGFVAQFWDLIVLSRLNPTCGIFDYYTYRVFAVERGGALYTELLGGKSNEEFNRSLNKRNAVTPASDKLVFAVLCNAYNIRTTEILAIYKPTGIVPEFVKTHLTDISELKAFLKREKMPIFVKPVKGSLGQGTFYIAGIENECEKIIDKGGKAISFDEFIEKTIGLKVSHRYSPKAGVSLQRIVQQHSAINEFTQTDTPSGLRILVLNTGSGPYIHRAVWKIVTPGNISDNFSNGAYGNMLGEIDVVTGQVGGAVDRYWPDAQLLEQHPVSGRKFSEFTLPLWEKVKAEVLNASSIINDMGAMHWDVIISEEGAVFLELNDLGGTNILQVHGKGLIDSELKKSLRQMAVLQKGSVFARFING